MQQISLFPRLYVVQMNNNYERSTVRNGGALTSKSVLCCFCQGSCIIQGLIFFFKGIYVMLSLEIFDPNEVK